MQLLIRRVTETDAETLEALSKRTFYDTFTGTCTAADMELFLNENFNLQQIQHELNNEQDLYYFAEVDGQPAGYLRLMEDYTGFKEIKKWKALELKRLYVDKPWHGKGIAQQLMLFAEDYAHKNHFEVMWLGVWEYNERAKRFYEKSGFKESGYSHDFPIGNTPQTDNYLWKFFN